MSNTEKQEHITDFSFILYNNADFLTMVTATHKIVQLWKKFYQNYYFKLNSKYKTEIRQNSNLYVW